MFTLLKVAFRSAGIALLASTSFAQQLPTSAISFSIEPQLLPDALKAWSKQSGLFFGGHAIPVDSQLTTPRVVGELSPEVALQSLLRGSGFTFSVIDNETVKILAEVSGTEGMTGDEEVEQKFARSNASGARSAISLNNERYEMPAEVVVTGTHLRGMRDSAAPVRAFTRDDIDRAGVGNVQDFVRTLPQFFGSASEATPGGTGGAPSLNSVGASGIDLRGLGVSSTLVLVNGRRVAPGNMVGNFVDISLIPLSAVRRIEMVTDGASSIYGADAIAGVVNLILRKDFEGAETRARYGAVDEGRRYEVTASQTFGDDWGSGHGMVTYEYLKGTLLSAKERGYSRSAGLPLTLLPDQTRHGAFAALEQSISGATQVFFDGLYSERSTVSASSIAGFALSVLTPAEIRERSGTVGLHHTFLSESQLEISAGYTQNDGRLRQYRVVPNWGLFSDVEAMTRITAIEANVEGELWEGSAGSSRYAIGAQYRNERYQSYNRLTNSGLRPARGLFATYVELQVPIFGPDDAQLWAEKLEFNLADRYEESDDFGSSNNPKIGILWTPIRWLDLRGTYSTSFKAPFLVDLNPVPAQVVPLPMWDPLSGAPISTLLVFGGNPDLAPEKATTWTLGAGIRLESLPNLKASATYYNIHLTDRILAPQTKVDIFDALRIENQLGPKIVQRNPPQSVIRQLAATSGFLNTGVDVQTIRALIDNRSLNLEIVDTSGIDLNIAYEFELRRGRLELGLDATRILKFESRFNAVSQKVSLLDTPYNPVAFRARGYSSFSSGPMKLGISVNYADGYRDSRTGSARPIASWTTADVTGSYRIASEEGILKHTSVTFGITNILGEPPPFVSNPIYGVNYDATNANGVGRLYSLELTKKY